MLSLAVSAIVGASWLDSGNDLRAVSQVIGRLGLVVTVRPSEVMPTDHSFTQSNTSPEQPTVPSFSRTASPMPSNTQPSESCWNGIFSVLRSPFATSEIPDRLISQHSAWSVLDIDSVTEQVSGHTLPLERNVTSAREDTVGVSADFAEHECYWWSFDERELFEEAPDCTSQSLVSPSNCEETEITRHEDDDHTTMSAARSDGVYRDDVVLFDTGFTEESRAAGTGQNEQSNNAGIRSHQTSERSISSTPRDDASRHDAQSISTGRGASEEVGLPSQAEVSPRTVVRRAARSASKRKKCVVQGPAKRRGSPHNLTMLDENNEASLEQHISSERRKYEVLGIECPEEFLNPLTIERRISSLNAGRYESMLITSFCAIGSCESLALLQDILRVHRDAVVCKVYATPPELSIVKRIEVIEGLSSKVAYYSLLKRCHILKLFMDSCSFSNYTDDGFVVDTQSSVSTRSQRQSGNPRNHAEAAITENMTREIYPTLQSKSIEFNEKHRYVSNLRRLGRRLHSLETAFGYGVLGLLPSTTRYSALTITDNM